MPKRRSIYIILAIVVTLIFIFGGYNYFKYPSNWKAINVGDTPEQVKAKCAQISQELHDIKGDFCYQGGLFHNWALTISYGSDDRVKETNLTLTIGTQDYFKRFYWGKLAT